MEQVRVAIIGHGHLGRWHTQKASQLADCKLVAIVEPHNQEAIRASYPEVKVVSDISQVLDEIDAAVIVTPTSTHFELTKLLLENKKHVFCEKPLCSTVEQVEALRPLLGEQKLQVGHSERCHQAWDSVKQYLSQIDTPKTIKINRFAPFKGRATDVDVVQDLMIHDIDLMLFLTGSQPSQLSSQGFKIRTDKWDHVTSHFFLENNDQVIITSGRNHVIETRELEIMSREGCLHVDLFHNKISRGVKDEVSEGVYVLSEDYEKRDHLLIEQQAFYQSILQDEKEMVTFEEGANAVVLVSKVLESLSKPGLMDV
jgi:predicted dehydrogenase